MAPLRCALVGCGNIAARYAARIAAEESLELVGATDLVAGRADAFAAEHGGTAYATLDDLLADDAVDVAVNLTAPRAHAEVTASCLRAGKHVHTEKPVALDHAGAARLAELAEENGVRLSCAPATLLGEAQQTVWRTLREGRVGRVRTAYAEANWGRIESWHPEPEALLSVGPLVDVGVYPLTILTGIHGPARLVHAYATTLEPERVRRDGSAFRLGSPDFVVAVAELADGLVVRLTASFYVGPSRQRGIEWHGDEGSLHLATWAESNSSLQLQPRGGEYEPVPLVREPYDGIDWGRPLVDLAAALEEGRPHRAAAEHAAHVVEILEAAETSAETATPVAVTSTFAPPEPLEWAR